MRNLCLEVWYEKWPDLNITLVGNRSQQLSTACEAEPRGQQWLKKITGMENVVKGRYSDLIYFELEWGEKILNAPKCSFGHRRKMMDLEEMFRSAATLGQGLGGEVTWGVEIMKPRIHQNGSHKEHKKGILNVCQLLLLTNTSSHFLYLSAVLIKIGLFFYCISNSQLIWSVCCLITCPVKTNYWSGACLECCFLCFPHNLNEVTFMCMWIDKKQTKKKGIYHVQA